MSDPPDGLALWWAGARPRTLPAAVVPVLVGTAAAAPAFVAWRFVAAMAVAVMIQVGTNFANDYSDGVRGTDGADRVGPMRLVGSGRARPVAVKWAAFGAFGVAGLAGLVLAAAVSWWLVLVGAVSFAAGWLYTGGPAPYGYLGLGELFVFVFFGLVATVGSAYVQAEAVTGLAVATAVPVGLLATALLVVNNLRDIPGDTRAGKRTLAVRMGESRTRWLYVVLVAGALLAVALVAVLGDRPLAALALVPGLVARRPVIQVVGGAAGVDLVPVLVDTGRFQLLLGLGLAVGIAAGA